jgi:DNA-binding response OmpR family regulator
MTSNSIPILLIEDSLNDVQLVQRAFRKANVSAALQIFNDGDTAVEYLSGEGQYCDRAQYPIPTFILLDLKLPRRSGSEVLSWLRQQSYLRRIPVVVLTASREDRDVNQLYDLGVNAYMVKPVMFNDLVEIIHTLNLHWLILNEKPQINLL